MLKRSLLGAVAVLMAALSQTPARADEPQQGYLRLLYFKQLMPGCGMQEPASSVAPFAIVDGKIRGYYAFSGEGTDQPIDELPLSEDLGDPDLPEVFTTPPETPHEIRYSFKCMACTETATILFHRVWGQVETVSGTPMLHFFVSHSRPKCTNTCMPPKNDCSDKEIVTDEFMTPFEDGYIVDRGPNTPFKYAVHLY